MKLSQKRYPFTTFEFELGDDVMKVTTKRVLGSDGFEVPLHELRPYPSFHRSFPLTWLVFAVIFAVISAFFLYAMLSAEPTEEELGLIIAFLVMLFASLACVHGFLQRKVDFIILHYEHTGSPAVFFHRRVPTEKHVQEFIEITKEHIQATRRA